MHLFRLLCISILLPFAASSQTLKMGAWRAEIQQVGGKIPINFIVSPGKSTKTFSIKLKNGNEKFSLGESYFRGDSLVIPFDLYESELIGAITNSNKITGYFVKKRDGKILARTPFTGSAGSNIRFTGTEKPRVSVTGTYRADFWSDENNHSEGVMILRQQGNRVQGTVLKPSGDYRFLEGNVHGDSLHLSYFDGSYMMLFKTKVVGKNITGKFFTGFAGVRNLNANWDPKASLPDLKKLTQLKAGADKIAFSLPSPTGELISLSDPRFKNKVVVIELMGSWCPNCIDESRYLAPFYTRYKAKGVEVLGLAFEYSPDLAISGPKITNFIKRVGIEYPILLAGEPNDETIARVLPTLQKMNGYPTTIIIDKKGIVREIHTGFSGPGTGVYYTDWILAFEKTIETLIHEK